MASCKCEIREVFECPVCGRLDVLEILDDDEGVSIEGDPGPAVPLDRIESAVWRGMRGDQPEPDHWPETLIAVALEVADEVERCLSTHQQLEQSTTGKEDCER